MNTLNFKKILVLFLLMSESSSFALAATSYTPTNDREYLAYLQGMLDALRSQLAANAGGSSKVETDTPTLKAEVKLSATYEVGSGSYVYAWFEYGIGSLNKKTTRTKVTKDRGDDEVTHTRTLTNLEENTLYSYRAVFENRNGVKSYGSVGTFNTNGTFTTGNFTTDRGGATVSSSKGSITLDATTYEPNKNIQIDWTIPRSKTDTSNWIGLYKTTASNSEYITWAYLKDDDEGTINFTAPSTKGSYEVRMFYNNSYNDVLTSKRITVK